MNEVKKIEVGEEGKKEEKSLYSWPSTLGSVLYDCLLEKLGDKERTKRQLKTFILNLRSEALPERFRRTLLDFIIEIIPDCEKSIGIQQKIKDDKPWRVDEFYRYSTAILSGLYDAIFGVKSSGKEGDDQNG